MTCSACGAEAIAGISHCVNCGQEHDDGSGPAIRIIGLSTPAEIAERAIDASAYHARLRRITEARALEIAGDLEGPKGAIAIYEELIDRGYDWPDAFKRLTIVYKKLKRPADEERVVRIALSRLGERVNTWFILRLATIIAKQKKDQNRLTQRQPKADH